MEGDYTDIATKHSIVLMVSWESLTLADGAFKTAALNRHCLSDHIR